MHNPQVFRVYYSADGQTWTEDESLERDDYWYLSRRLRERSRAQKRYEMIMSKSDELIITFHNGLIHDSMERRRSKKEPVIN